MSATSLKYNRLGSDSILAQFGDRVKDKDLKVPVVPTDNPRIIDVDNSLSILKKLERSKNRVSRPRSGQRILPAPESFLTGQLFLFSEEACRANLRLGLTMAVVDDNFGSLEFLAL